MNHSNTNNDFFDQINKALQICLELCTNETEKAKIQAEIDKNNMLKLSSFKPETF